MYRNVILILLAVFIAACGPTGDTATDETSAENLLPNISGYTATQTNSVITALTAAGAGAALTGGNVPVAVALERTDKILQCLQERGAVGARVYVEQNPTSIVPEAGAAVVLNQTRFNRNLLSCLVEGSTSGFSTQSVTIEPCTGSGNFTFRDEEFAYIYVGVGPNLCGYFSQHFTNLGGTG